LKAENGPFLEKMAPCVAPSPLPLKTPETEVVIQITAIGGGPGNLRGSISLPLLGVHASDARKNISYGRQKSQKPTVVGISTGFLTFMTLLTGRRRQEVVRQIESVGTHLRMNEPQGLADLETDDPVFNIKAAARLCDTSHATVRRRLQADKFPKATRAANGQDWEIPLSDLLEAGLRPSGQQGAELLKNVDDVKTLRSRLDKSEARVQELEDELGALRLQHAEADIERRVAAARAEAYLSAINANARAGADTGTPEMPLERAA
jgi:hypothetical protein